MNSRHQNIRAALSEPEKKNGLIVDKFKKNIPHLKKLQKDFGSFIQKWTKGGFQITRHFPMKKDLQDDLIYIIGCLEGIKNSFEKENAVYTYQTLSLKKYIADFYSALNEFENRIQTKKELLGLTAQEIKEFVRFFRSFERFVKYIGLVSKNLYAVEKMAPIPEGDFNDSPDHPYYSRGRN